MEQLKHAHIIEQLREWQKRSGFKSELFDKVLDGFASVNSELVDNTIFLLSDPALPDLLVQILQKTQWKQLFLLQLVCLVMIMGTKSWVYKRTNGWWSLLVVELGSLFFYVFALGFLLPLLLIGNDFWQLIVMVFNAYL